MRGKHSVLTSWSTVAGQVRARHAIVGELEHKLELCHRENNNLRRQVRCSRNEVDKMRQREYEDRHDHYERHDSYDRRKRRRTSTEVTPSSSGGYVWPQPKTPQIVVSPPRSLTLPCDPTSPPRAPSPVAPMEVDAEWPPLPPPGELNQLNATTPRLPIIPMHQALNEHDTMYPMLPKGFHRSRVDNTVHAAKAAQRNEALGAVPLRNTMRPSDCGFPQTVADWEGLLRSTRKKGNTKALHIARAFVTQAQHTPAVQRTEPQRQVLREWTYPDWFQHPACKGKEHAVPKLGGRQMAALPGRPSASSHQCVATSALEPSHHMFPDLPPLHADGWQPCHVDEVHLGMPMLRDDPKMWAEWIDQHPDKCPRGIVVMPDGCMSMCGIHGMQLIKQRNP
jgi:hypothetical protein